MTVNFLNSKESLSVKAKRVISHPKSATHGKYDIALIELASPVNIKPSNIDFYSYNCQELLANMSNPIAAGYSGSDVLSAVSLTWGEPCLINDMYWLKYQGYAQKGDSGGPLFFQNMNNAYVLGVCSAGTIYNVIFASLSLNQNFINKYIELNRNPGDNRILGTSLLTSNWTDISAASATSATHVVNILLFSILMPVW